MSKEEFIKTLRTRLHTLTKEEKDEAISFYEEMIADSIEEGKDEKEAVALLGNIDDIVIKILENENVRQRSNNKTERIVLLCCLSPFLLTGFLLIYALYLVFYSVLVCFYAVGVCLYTVPAAAVLNFITNGWQTLSYTILSIGAAIFSVGAAIFCFPAVTKLWKEMNRLTVSTWRSMIGVIRGEKYEK